MRVLVTRPRPDAGRLCDRLRALGHTPLVDPLLSIEFLPLPSLPSVSPAAVLVTSQNALWSLSRQADVLARLAAAPLFAVGPATAGLARDLGFSNVFQGSGTGEGLAEAAAARLQPQAGTLLYLAGEVTSFDVGAALSAQGFTVETAIVYRTVPAGALHQSTLAALQAHEIEAVVLLSARTARTYATLMRMHNQLENIRNIPHLCLSDTIARGLEDLGPLLRRVPASPSVEELLALISCEAKSLP